MEHVCIIYAVSSTFNCAKCNRKEEVAEDDAAFQPLLCLAPSLKRVCLNCAVQMKPEVAALHALSIVSIRFMFRVIQACIQINQERRESGPLTAEEIFLKLSNEDTLKGLMHHLEAFYKLHWEAVTGQKAYNGTLFGDPTNALTNNEGGKLQ